MQDEHVQSFNVKLCSLFQHFCDVTYTKSIDLSIPFYLECSSANFSFQGSRQSACSYNFSLFRNISSPKLPILHTSAMSSPICNL